MSGTVVIYAGASIILAWGIAHLFPTRSVVRGFGEISSDNSHIIVMEWITEGVSLVFIGLLTGVVNYIDRGSPVSSVVFWSAFIMLNTLSGISLFTGFRHSFIAFKLCPFIFTGSSLLIIVGSYID